MYAYYDELTRQVSVVGRTGTIKDVIIDSAGAFTGIAILFMVVVTFNGIRGFIRFVFRKSEA
jgi:VanZ family protein